MEYPNSNTGNTPPAVRPPDKAPGKKGAKKKWWKWLFNKQVLIFLFFLALSTAFWLFNALNETYEEEYLVPIELRNVPSNVVITTDLPKNMHVTLRDKGSVLLAYRYTRRLKAVVVDFATYAGGSGYATIQGSELTRQIAVQLLPTTQMTAAKPDLLEFYYNYGLCKRVPVVLRGDIRAGASFSLAATRYDRDSVLVYASKEILDTITAAYTQSVVCHELTDTTTVEAQFLKIRGAKFVPNKVNFTFCIDRMVEKSVQVPVQQVNFPAGKQLRTFPANVSISFQVGMGHYRSITSESFVLTANYEDLLKNDTGRCHLSLKTVPNGVSHVRITPSDVEFIIEDIVEDESDAAGE